MNKEERYEMILEEKDKPILEIGFSSTEEPHRTINNYYFLCHSCKDGLKSFTHDKIILQAVAHMASEEHMILLERNKK